MDPLSVIGQLVSAAQFLYEASQEVKDNEEECSNLQEHAKQLGNVIRGRYMTPENIPQELDEQLNELAKTIGETAKKVKDLSSQSLFSRALRRKGIRKSLDSARKSLNGAVEVAQLGSEFDMVNAVHKLEEARKHDERSAEDAYKRILDSNEHMLQIVQLERKEMREMMRHMQRHLRHFPKEMENEFLARGLHVLQSISGDTETHDDDFQIARSDVSFDETNAAGQGGFATVYEGDWLGTQVAVKVINKGVPCMAIQKEIDVWKKLRHPNIVEFFGACTTEKPSFIICAFKGNGNIIDYLHNHPNTKRARLLYDACLGLVYLHQHGVVHGDLKGNNILVDENGRACLSDFGLSRIKGSSSTMQTVSASRQATLRWTSPEQTLYGTLSQKTDIYSFAMTMYEILTGLAPFAYVPDDALWRVIYDLGGRPPRRAADNIDAPQLDDDMWDLVTSCWAQQPEDRPLAKDVAQRLEILAARHHPAPSPLILPISSLEVPPLSPIIPLLRCYTRSQNSLRSNDFCITVHEPASPSPSMISVLNHSPTCSSSPSRAPSPVISPSPIRTSVHSTALYGDHHVSSPPSPASRTSNLAHGTAPVSPNQSTSFRSIGSTDEGDTEKSSEERSRLGRDSSSCNGHSRSIGRIKFTLSRLSYRSDRNHNEKGCKTCPGYLKSCVPEFRPVKRFETSVFNRQIEALGNDDLGQASEPRLFAQVSSSLQRLAALDDAYSSSATIFKKLDEKYIPYMVDITLGTVAEGMTSMLFKLHECLLKSKVAGQPDAIDELTRVIIRDRLVKCARFCNRYAKRWAIRRFLTGRWDLKRMEWFLAQFKKSEAVLDKILSG